MKRLHPNRRFACLTAGLFVAACAVGCRGSQSSMTNPFLGADRVPPPSTRVVAPGAPAPYYPGAAPPAAQTATAPPGAALAAAPIATPQQPPPSPGVPVFSSPSRSVASANESPVTIPTDESQMRFPPPTPTNFAANTTPQAAAPNANSALTAATTAASASTPAAYNSAQQYHIAETDPPAATSSGPWRSPQIAKSGTSPALAPQQQVSQVVAPAWQQLAPAPQPGVVAPPLTPVASKPVQMRTVTSPPVEQVAIPQPRIHFPSQIATDAPSGGVVAASAQVPAGASVTGDVVQTVQIGALPPSAVATPATPASADGFRPRSSLK